MKAKAGTLKSPTAGVLIPFKTPANALFDNFIPLLDFSSVDVADCVFVSVVQWV